MTLKLSLKHISITRAEGEKESAILRAEAVKQQRIREAEGEAQALLMVQKAKADSIRLINEAAPSPVSYTHLKKHGIRIILDGVFSHTGSDSLYFNREGRYGPGGAYRDRCV